MKHLLDIQFFEKLFVFFEGVISLLDPWLLFYTRGKTFQGFLRD